MGGGIIELVANTSNAQNKWLNEAPQITFFKKVYRRHTPFASETIPLKFNSDLAFGKSSTVKLTMHGDLINRAYVTFDIPKLYALFLNTKSEDIVKVIDSLKLSDVKLLDLVKSCAISNDRIDIDQLFYLMDEFARKYDREVDAKTQFLAQLNNYFVTGQIELSDRGDAAIDDLDTEFIPVKAITSTSTSDIIGDLQDLFIQNYPDLFLIRQLIKLLETSPKMRIIDTKNIFDNIFGDQIFGCIISNKEILFFFYMDTSRDHSDIASKIKYDMPLLAASSFVPDTLSLIQQRGADVAQQLFYDFGPNFFYTLNTYNIIISILKSLGRTVPIIIARAFELEDAYDIYTDNKSVLFSPTQYDAVIDLNYKNKFISNVNNVNFSTTDFIHSATIYPNAYPNTYLNYFVDRANLMHENIRSRINGLFNKYRTGLFMRTNNLFLSGSNRMTNIYSYNVPTQPHTESGAAVIFNLNIWFFYFFLYLDSLDECSLVSELVHVHSGIVLDYVSKIITLLKINIHFYMNEISYLLNDLYASSPSTDIDDTMKNYTPNSYSSNDGLVILTMIFHRSNVPSIKEIFEFTFNFISNIDRDRINKYLRIELPEIEEEDFLNAKSVAKSLYENIYAHFCGGRAATGGGDSDVCRFAQKFLVQQLAPIALSQMEFYFSCEMVHAQEIQNFYDDLLFDNRHKCSTLLDIVSIMTDKINTQSYYATYDLDRYSGKAYQLTSYLSRSHGEVEAPLVLPYPLPPSDPYGVNAAHYDNQYPWVNFMSVPNNFTKSVRHAITNAACNDGTKSMSAHIDFYAIKHSLFHSFVDNDSTNVISNYQFNVLKLLSIINNIIATGAEAIAIDNYVAFWIEDAVKNILEELEHDHVTIQNLLINFVAQLKRSNLTKNLLALIVDQLAKLRHGYIYDASNLIRLGDAKNLNIIEQIIFMRDAFLSQYYFYVENKGGIVQLYEKKNKNYTFASTLDIKRELSLEACAESTDIFTMNGHRLITMKDAIDTINTSFMAIKNLYKHYFDNGTTAELIATLEPFKKIILRKHKILQQLAAHFDTNSCSLTEIELIMLKGNIPGGIFRKYIKDTLGPYLSAHIDLPVSEKIYLVHSLIEEDIDGLLMGGCIKSAILANLSEENYKYFDLIDGKYYPCLYLFIMFATNGGIHYDDIKNPLVSLDLSDENFSLTENTKDVSKYLQDYIFDDLIEGRGAELRRVSNIEVEETTLVENFLSNKNFDKVLTALSNTAGVSVADLITDLLTKPIQINNAEIIEQNAALITKLSDMIRESISTYELRKAELAMLEATISTILYRNPEAKFAWVKKLAHFLIEDVSFKISDEITAYSLSDWLETWNDIKKDAGKKRGYNKMIGNVSELTVFDAGVKNAFTIMMPLIFYFNNSPALSLPLSASSNTEYHITIKLRSLSEVTYREEFSSFVNPDDLHDKFYVPKITNSVLMCEYVYISTCERKIFATSNLEYLFQETQYDSPTILNDGNMMPIYKLATKKHNIKYYGYNEGIYVAKSQYDGQELEPFKIYSMVQSKNKNGIDQRTFVDTNTSADINAHAKRIEHAYHFNHPTEYMVTLIKPLAHTDPSIRHANSNYFYGERQWDNYGLYARYDLTNIRSAKLAYFLQLKNAIGNITDANFGFRSLIDQLLVYHAGNNNGIERFMELLQFIKEQHINYDVSIKDNHASIWIKEIITSLNINYPIMSEYLPLLIQDILQLLNVNVSYPTLIVNNKRHLIDAIHSMLAPYIENNLINIEHITHLVDVVYDKYNAAITNTIVKYLSDDIIAHDIANLLQHSQFVDAPNIISFALATITKRISELSRCDIKKYNNAYIPNAKYKQIIDQLINYSTDFYTNYVNIISYAEVSLVADQLAKRVGYLLDNQEVPIINYSENLIKNPKVNPLMRGFMEFNSANIMPENSNGLMWSEAEAYQYFNHTPSVGINLHSWAFIPLQNLNTGSVNLSKINKFKATYDVHPLIGNDYPAVIVTMTSSLNIMRYLSGMCGKAWQLTR